jgi:hypothetical protein
MCETSTRPASLQWLNSSCSSGLLHATARAGIMVTLPTTTECHLCPTRYNCLDGTVVLSNRFGHGLFSGPGPFTKALCGASSCAEQDGQKSSGSVSV